MITSKLPQGPTYEEMLHPGKLPPVLRQKALTALAEDEREVLEKFLEIKRKKDAFWGR